VHGDGDGGSPVDSTGIGIGVAGILWDGTQNCDVTVELDFIRADCWFFMF